MSKFPNMEPRSLQMKSIPVHDVWRRKLRPKRKVQQHYLDDFEQDENSCLSYWLHKQLHTIPVQEVTVILTTGSWKQVGHLQLIGYGRLILRFLETIAPLKL